MPTSISVWQDLAGGLRSLFLCPNFIELASTNPKRVLYFQENKHCTPKEIIQNTGIGTMQRTIHIGPVQQSEVQ